jgi:hypothetical protein
MIGCALVMAASWLPFLLATPPPLPLSLAAMVAMGLGGGAMVVAYAAARDYFAGEGTATALSIVNSTVLLAGAGLQTFVGWFLDLGWRGELFAGARLYPPEAWRGAWILLFLSPLAGALCAFLLPKQPARGKTRSAGPGSPRKSAGTAQS